MLIPGGYTYCAQPLGVTINKPFKGYLKNEHNKFMETSIRFNSNMARNRGRLNFHFHLHHINTRIYATQNNLSNLMVKKESEDIEMDVGETAPIVFSWD